MESRRSSLGLFLAAAVGAMFGVSVGAAEDAAIEPTGRMFACVRRRPCWFNGYIASPGHRSSRRDNSMAVDRPCPPKCEDTEVEATKVVAPPAVQSEPAPPLADEPPSISAGQFAEKALEVLEGVRDYSCTLVTRERIDGELGEPRYLFVKVRHEPLSIYYRILKPNHSSGCEAIYVSGRNEDNALIHGVGCFVRTVALPAELKIYSARRPITELGIAKLTERLMDIGGGDATDGEREVKYFRGARINGRSNTRIQVRHSARGQGHGFHVAQIYLDDEHRLPTRYEVHDWPSREGGKPILIEEHTYLKLKLNNGFTDADFDVRNPEYGYNVDGWPARNAG